jgi:hypothetical protein
LRRDIKMARLIGIRYNEEKNGIELLFDGKPNAATREQLKSTGFRWHPTGRYWYAKRNAAREGFARDLQEELVC